jgi:hypothetical protein
MGVEHPKAGSDRVGNWHGTTTGPVVFGGRKVSVGRPRGRYVDGGEVELATWSTFADEDLLAQIMVERMLAGIRRHVDVAEPSPRGISGCCPRANVTGIPGCSAFTRWHSVVERLPWTRQRTDGATSSSPLTARSTPGPPRSLRSTGPNAGWPTRSYQ